MDDKLSKFIKKAHSPLNCWFAVSREFCEGRELHVTNTESTSKNYCPGT